MATNKAPELSVAVNQSDLISVMARVTAVVEKRTTIPILSYAKLIARDGRVAFVASDLDIEIRDSIEAREIDMEGEITVPAQTLYDIARKLPKGCEISLIAADNRVQITAGRSNFSLPVLSPADFPLMSSDTFSSEFTLTCGTFKDIIDRTKFAISTEETRYYLNGIYLHGVDGGDNGILRAVSTDGHRLAMCQIAAPDGAQTLPGIIIPRKTVLEIRRIADGFPKESDIDIKVSDNKIQFITGNMTMTSKLIDGTFPDYDRVIPRDNESVMSVDCQIMRAAVDRVATILEGKSRSIALKISRDNLVIETPHSPAGSAREDMAVEYQGPDLKIGFNAKYLADTFSQIISDKIVFHLGGPASPALVKDPDNTESLFVLMPLRV